MGHGMPILLGYCGVEASEWGWLLVMRLELVMGLVLSMRLRLVMEPALVIGLVVKGLLLVSEAEAVSGAGAG